MQKYLKATGCAKVVEFWISSDYVKADYKSQTDTSRFIEGIKIAITFPDNTMWILTVWCPRTQKRSLGDRPKVSPTHFTSVYWMHVNKSKGDTSSSTFTATNSGCGMILTNDFHFAPCETYQCSFLCSAFEPASLLISSKEFKRCAMNYETSLNTFHNLI